jgi:hypothetical protein
MPKGYTHPTDLFQNQIVILYIAFLSKSEVKLYLTCLVNAIFFQKLFNNNCYDEESKPILFLLFISILQTDELLTKLQV